MSMRGSAAGSVMGPPQLLRRPERIGRARMGARRRLRSQRMKVAALDLGTNSFHLLIADVHADGTFTALSREKEMLRLGDVVSREGVITPDAAEQAVATVRRMKLLADAAGVTEIAACATSAIR